jgi:hypothetical protein
MPYIKLESVKDTVLGKAKAVEISGQDLVKNETWTKKFFKNKTQLVEALQNFEVGDEVNVVMEQDPENSRWWNIVDFKDMTEDDRGKIQRKQAYNPAARSGGGAAPRRADGGSRGDDTNRSAAVYLAHAMIKELGTDYEGDFAALAKDCVHLAHTIIYPYISAGATAKGDEGTPPVQEEAAPAKPKLPRV